MTQLQDDVETLANAITDAFSSGGEVISSGGDVVIPEALAGEGLRLARALTVLSAHVDGGQGITTLTFGGPGASLFEKGEIEALDLSGIDPSDITADGSYPGFQRVPPVGQDGLYLRGADLSGLDLSGALFDRAYLDGASFEGSDLSGASFTDALLRDANMRSITAHGASFSDFGAIDLQGADFTGADLTGAHFYQVDALETAGATFAGADLTDALVPTDFVGDLAQLEGADGVFTGMAGERATVTHFFQAAHAELAPDTSWVYPYSGDPYASGAAYAVMARNGFARAAEGQEAIDPDRVDPQTPLVATRARLEAVAGGLTGGS